MIVLKQLFHHSDEVAWLGGIFFWYGFLSHLLLDEITQVNLGGQSYQKPFGSSFKFGAKGKGLHFCAAYLIALGLVFFIPSYVVLHDNVMSQLTWYSIKSHLFPG